MNKVRTLGAAFALAISIALSSTAVAKEPVKTFDIPAQSLSEALADFSRQSDVIIFAPSELTKGKTSGTVAGELELTEALETLLNGTGLNYTREADGGFIIRALAKEQSRERVNSPRKVAQVQPSETPERPKSATEAVEEEEQLVLEEIVVTALRRGEQDLLDVPLAITAFGGDWIENRGFTSLNDFIQLAPGVTNAELVPGFHQIQMRGISAGVGENNVGYYLDEVPFAYIFQNNVPDLRSFDLERVEILRGPQSTLYGAGAIAGVVRTITRDPVLDAFEFKGDGSVSSIRGGGTNWEGNVAINLPIVQDRLALRVVYIQEEQSGWIDQTVLGIDNANQTDLKNFRIKLLGQVNDKLSISAMAWGSRLDTFSSSSAFDDGTNNEAVETLSSFDYDIYNLTINYAGDKMGLVSSTSYMTVDTKLVFDVTLPIPGFPPATLDNSFDPKTFTQEVRLFSKYDGPWQWTAGAYYRNTRQNRIQESIVLPLLGLDPSIQFDKVKAWNVFAEVTRTFLDGKLDVTAGGRFLKETRSTEQKVRPSEPFESNFDAATARVNVTYRPQDNWMTYFNFGQGFRSGVNQLAISLDTAAVFGVILPAAVDPEHVNSFEFGIKGEFLDGRLTLDAAAYLIKWKDMQTIIPVVANVLSGVVNASRAKSPGVEVAVNWLAAQGLTVGLVGGWNDSHIVGDVFAEQLVFDPQTGIPTTETILLFADGDRLNLVPEWTLGATLDYIRKLSNAVTLVATGSAQYATQREFRAFGPKVVGDKLLTVDARIGVDIGRWGWGMYLFVRNLTNEDGIIIPSGFKFPNFGTRPRPRTIGVNFKFRY